MSAPAAPAAVEDDAFAAAVDGLAPTDPTAQPGAQLAPVKKYPPFIAAEWRDNPIAKLVNSGADMLAKAPEGTAAKADLGETYCWAVACYTNPNGEIPPWAVAILATGNFILLSMGAKKLERMAENNAAADNPRAGEAVADDRTKRERAPARRGGGELAGIDWGDG